MTARHYAGIIAAMLLSCLECSAEADCEIAPTEQVCSTCTSVAWGPTPPVTPPDAGVGPTCDDHDGDAGAPDVPASEPPFDWRERIPSPWPDPIVKVIEWYTERCDTCFVPCGFGPKGCMRPVTCCGKHIVGEEPERDDP